VLGHLSADGITGIFHFRNIHISTP
jgi:hypothetical protein